MTQRAGDHKQLCGYLVRRQLGPDSYLATDERDQAIVIKKLDASCLLQGRLHPAIRDRLQHVRELPLINVANLNGIEQDGQVAYLIWNFVEGRTLNEVLASPESPDAAVAAIREAKWSMNSLHDAGLVHGAIHGGNIIIDEHGKAHLTHISPLLFHDPDIDRAAFRKITGDRELGEAPLVDDRPSHGHVGYQRRQLIGGAIGIALIGFIIAILIAYGQM